MNLNIFAYLNKFIIQDAGIRNNPESYKRLLLTINVIFLGGLAMLLFGIMEVLNGYFLFVLVNFIAFFFSCIALWFIRLGKRNLAVDIILAVFLVVMAINASIQGREVGNYLLYFPIMAAVLCMCPCEKRWKGLSWLGAIVVLIVVQEIFDYKLIPNFEYKVENVRQAFALNLFVSFGITMLLIMELVKINNITERKLLDLNDSLLKSNEELQKTNNELDSFVYRASHDIRSPISTAKGLISISKNETDINQIKMYLDLQEKSLNKLESFVTAILDHSRNSRAEIEFKPIDFKSVVGEILQQSMPAELQEKADVKIKVEDLVFLSDSDRIQTIFINLLGNAIKYRNQSREKFELLVSVEKVKDSIVIVVKDNGIGIPPDLQPRIFEMFFRATQLSNGSGLGLYIVKEAIEKLGGSISLQSKMGEGTTFEIILPNHANI